MKDYWLLSEDENENKMDFLIWAVGAENIDEPANMFTDYWNKLHGDKLHLHGSDDYWETIPKLLELWRAEK